MAIRKNCYHYLLEILFSFIFRNTNYHLGAAVEPRATFAKILRGKFFECYLRRGARRASTMPRRREPTLADAQRQVNWRRGIGWLLMGLSGIFLLLFMVKALYVLSYSPFSAAWGARLHNFIGSLLEDWAVLDLLWRAIPPWQPVTTVSETELWSLIYATWIVMVVILVGKLLLRSASTRHAQIAEFHREMQREAWRQQARTAQGLPPDDRASTTIIGQATLHQYPAPPESWSQTPRGIMILGLIVTLIGGVVLLCLEYGYFQAR
jgi:hypothetical protein